MSCCTRPWWLPPLFSFAVLLWGKYVNKEVGVAASVSVALVFAL